EAAGVVTAVGDAVTDIKVGDRVVTVAARGAYAEETIVPADQIVQVPEAVALEIAGAVFLQGLTAHYLAVDTFPLQPGHHALIHAAAGGVGRLLVQIAKRRGAHVTAIVGNRSKVETVKRAGADE